MNNREIFQKNLNELLRSSGRMQKDLAEYVGAKTTTVSGWTRGISYPRADAMEKIALFFGIPTSRLVGSENLDAESSPASIDLPADEIRLLIPGVSKLPPEQVERTKNAFLAMFKATYPELFEKEGDDDK